MIQQYWVPFRILSSLAFLVSSLVAFNQFADWVETRPGVVLPDPVLSLFSAVDLTVPIFAGVYGCIVLGIFYKRKKPLELANMFVGYGILLLLRILSMALVPLAAPEGMILLRDPVVELFGSNGRVLTQDLFYSGHTSVSFLIAFFYKGSNLQKWFFLVAASIGGMVIAQKVHYSIDVWVAPFFSYASYRVATKLGEVARA